MADKTIKLKVTEGSMVNHDGKLHESRSVFQAQKSATVDAWIASGAVEEVKGKK